MIAITADALKESMRVARPGMWEYELEAIIEYTGALITHNGGETWSSWYNQPTAQLYHIGITPTFTNALDDPATPT